MLLSRFAAELPEAEVEAMLTRTWAELDRAAEKAKGMDPVTARGAIQDAVRGEGGISEQFRRTISEKAEERRASASSPIKRAARHPLFWALIVLFLAALVLLNRRRA